METKETQALVESVRQIAKMYLLAVRNNEKTPDEQHGDETFLKNQMYIDKVNEAFNKLDGLERSLINNDFFYQAYPDWWKKQFSRSTYYRIRKSSVRHFKMAFENEE